MHPAKAYALSASPYTVATFRALVEAIVPNTPELAVFGAEQTTGAAEQGVQDYLIWELDHTLALFFGMHLTNFPLSAPTAGMLNAGAVQLVASGQALQAPNHTQWEISPYSAISPLDRIRVLAMLEELKVDLGALPPPYRGDGGLVKFIVDYLNRATMFGFYSEWPAYGTTRLAAPTERRLEYFPIGWRQAGYPGVSLGYRALRGFLLTIVREGGESTIV
ncbi:hypothetical protein [Paenibacillus sp. NEAU-GSW1]|uniref:hypothetical protein n=1 Tax=Paenibacillus sp. NEAU-GSW1 TaxID=2682486 RepID=UPI0012E1DBFC|nr:hypothetical protein [Paenibacillus sp. NEAU-GSW1]MUT68611.1 hypothetical protein [Paenibacillus sp. NEAU-GSW1]